MRSPPRWPRPPCCWPPARAATAPAPATLVLSGNIEVTDAQLGFKVPGRVAERLVSEGDRVQAGQLVARLDDVEQREQLALRRAELAGAEAALAELVAGSRPQEIAAAEATLRSAEADRDRTRLDFARQQELRAKDAIADRELEASQAQLKVAEARTAEAAERLKLVQGGSPRRGHRPGPRAGRTGPRLRWPSPKPSWKTPGSSPR